MKAEELDQKFDEGEAVLEYFDLGTARRPGLKTERVSGDLPVWMLEALDREAHRLGVHRQVVIKTWLAQILDKKAA